MQCVRRDNRSYARFSEMRLIAYGDFDLTLEHLIDFLFTMAVFMNASASIKIVMGECHMIGMEKATPPAR